MVQCWALSTLNEHRPHHRLKSKAENVDADKFQKNKKNNKACDTTFVGIGKIMKISSKNLTGISQYNGSLMAYI